MSGLPPVDYKLWYQKELDNAVKRDAALADPWSAAAASGSPYAADFWDLGTLALLTGNKAAARRWFEIAFLRDLPGRVENLANAGAPGPRGYMLQSNFKSAHARFESTGKLFMNAYLSLYDPRTSPAFPQLQWLVGRQMAHVPHFLFWLNDTPPDVEYGGQCASDMAAILFNVLCPAVYVGDDATRAQALEYYGALREWADAMRKKMGRKVKEFDPTRLAEQATEAFAEGSGAKFVAFAQGNQQGYSAGGSLWKGECNPKILAIAVLMGRRAGPLNIPNLPGLSSALDIDHYWQ